MTDTTQPRLTCRTDRTLIRAGGRSRALHPRRARGADRRPRRVAPSAARQPRVRARPVGLDAAARQARPRQAGRRRGARPARPGGPLQRRRLRRPGRRRRRQPSRLGQGAPEGRRRRSSRSRPAARRTSPAAGSPAATRSPRHLVESGVNRCLLLTDGLANVGIVDPAELERHAGELRARGVATTTFGVGEDFNESLLQAMADAGGGHFYFAASVVEIRDHITSEVGETLDVVARDVTLEVTAPETVRVESMAPFRTEARGSRTLIRIGDLVVGPGRPDRAPGDVPVRRGRPRDRGARRRDRSRRGLPPGRAGARAGRPRVAVRRQSGERRATAGPRRRSGRGPDLRRPRPAGGRPAQPRRATTRRPRRRWPACQGGSGTTRAATRSSRRSRPRCGWRSRPTPPRCPRWPASRATGPRRTWPGCAPRRASRSSAPKS